MNGQSSTTRALARRSGNYCSRSSDVRYSFAALIYEVHAAVGSVLFRFRSQSASQKHFDLCKKSEVLVLSSTTVATASMK